MKFFYTHFTYTFHFLSTNTPSNISYIRNNLKKKKKITKKFPLNKSEVKRLKESKISSSSENSFSFSLTNNPSQIYNFEGENPHLGEFRSSHVLAIFTEIAEENGVENPAGRQWTA